MFYNADGWYLKDLPFSRFIYDYANVPAFIIFFGSILMLIFGYWKQKYAIYRKINLFLILIMLLGPGLIVNGIFKAYWGRPRPRQITEFGGSSQYLTVWQKGVSGAGHSFPSGHASIGFYLFVLFFIFRKKNPKLAYGSLLFALLFGILVGIIRIVQGGHFASDVMWAAGFVYLSSLIFYKILNLDIEPFWSEEPFIKVNKVAFAFAIIIPISFYFIFMMGFMKYPKLAIPLVQRKTVNQIHTIIPDIELNYSESFQNFRKESLETKSEIVTERITIKQANSEYLDINVPVNYWDPSFSMQP
jgi:membrane-associated PAP2 superfamily phosphatase